MKKDTVATKYKIKTTYLRHSYYNKEIIGNESNHMIKKNFQLNPKVSSTIKQLGEQQYKEQKIVAKMLSEGRRCGEIDCEANHKRVKMAKFPENNPSLSAHSKPRRIFDFVLV